MLTCGFLPSVRVVPRLYWARRWQRLRKPDAEDSLERAEPEILKKA